MADIKLNEAGDIDLTEGAMSLVRDSDAIAQHLRIRLRMIKGEAFQAPTEGMPFFETIFEKGTRGTAVAAVFRKAILETPGVLSLTAFDVTQEPTTRKVLVDFEAIVEGSDTPLTFSEFVI